MTAFSMVSRARIETFIAMHFNSPVWGANDLYNVITPDVRSTSDAIILLHLDFKEGNRDKLMSQCNQLLDALEKLDAEGIEPNKESVALIMLGNMLRLIKSQHRRPVLPQGVR